ncbi:hypothetical protein EC988_008103, partial [Linderina pennispora]
MDYYSNQRPYAHQPASNSTAPLSAGPQAARRTYPAVQRAVSPPHSLGYRKPNRSMPVGKGPQPF